MLNSACGRVLSTLGNLNLRMLIGECITRTFLWPPGSEMSLHVHVTADTVAWSSKTISHLSWQERDPLLLFAGFQTRGVHFKSCLKWIFVQKVFSSCFCKRQLFFSNAERSSGLTSVWLPECLCAFFPMWVSGKTILSCVCEGSWVTAATRHRHKFYQVGWGWLNRASKPILWEAGKLSPTPMQL